MNNRLHLLCPPPQVVELRQGSTSFATLKLDQSGLSSLQTDLLFTALKDMTQLHASEKSPTLTLRVEWKKDLNAQGYELVVGSSIELKICDDSGLFYGLTTLKQLIECGEISATGVTLPCLRICDWPDFAVRGFMLDISRCKVPTMDSLKRLVELLALSKFNQFQLYMEHTFAYAGHERVWANASPMTAAEIRELDDFCAARLIELVPNQNSCGHMHRWLIHDDYRDLAEVPEGVAHPFYLEPEPFSLCPTDPRIPPFLGELYDQLLPHFRSRLLNVGLDETFDIGRGRSAEACAARGRDEVYLDFLKKVHELARERGHRIQFWGDILIERPDLIADVPADAIALEWGYEADHPFAAHAAAFARSGHEFYVCPGTSSWNSLAGRRQNMLENLALAAREGRRNGARGFLLTDWGDFGHWQPEPVSYPGLVAGASFAWNAQAAERPMELALDEILAQRLGETNGGLARGLHELGELYRKCGALPPNGSTLFFILLFFREAPEHPKLRGLSDEALVAIPAQLDEIRHAIEGSDACSEEAELVREELLWLVEALRFSAEFARVWLVYGQGRYPAGVVDGLLARYRELREPFRRIWLARNRGGGLEESLAYMSRLEAFLEERREAS